MRSEKSAQTGERKRRMVRELWKALGIDPETTPDHLTLGEIGLESMFAVELQQELEREFNVKIGLNHIKSIEVGMLKDYEAGKMEKIEGYLNELKTSREALLKYKFIIPTETHILLNSGKKGKPIYFLPPLEITYSGMDWFVSLFDRPVIGLNWTKDMREIKTQKEINDYFIKLLKKLEPNGNYDLLGYLDGAIVISKLLLKGQINKAVIVDVFSETNIKDDTLTDDNLIEVTLSFLSKSLPPRFTEKTMRLLASEPDLNSKIKRLVQELKEFVGRGLIATDLEEIFHTTVKRSRIMFEYRTQKKKKFSTKLKETLQKKWAKKTGKLIIIKPISFVDVEDLDEEIEKSRDIYLLPQNVSFD